MTDRDYEVLNSNPLPPPSERGSQRFFNKMGESFIFSFATLLSLGWGLAIYNPNLVEYIIPYLRAATLGSLALGAVSGAISLRRS